MYISNYLNYKDIQFLNIIQTSNLVLIFTLRPERVRNEKMNGPEK